MKQNINYTNACIYQIYCKDPTIPNIYIGSTYHFKRRRANHKYNSSHETASEYNYKLYKYIREHGSWDNWTMEIIEKYICDNRYDLVQREKYYIKNNRNLLNTK